MEGLDVDDCDGVQKLRSRSRRWVVGFQVAKFEVGAVGKHHCKNEGVAANPCGAVQNSCETHVQACVIVAIEIKESDRSASAVRFFQVGDKRKFGPRPFGRVAGRFVCEAAIKSSR